MTGRAEESPFRNAKKERTSEGAARDESLKRESPLKAREIYKYLILIQRYVYSKWNYIHMIKYVKVKG